MSQFLVRGQPLENLRLLYEGNYLTKALDRHEKHNAPKVKCATVATLSALTLLFFASMTPPTFKKMAAFYFGCVAAGLIFYPGSQPKKTDLDERQQIFQEVTLLVDAYAQTKIEAVEELLKGVKIRQGADFTAVDIWAGKLYDTFEQPFAIPSNHPDLNYNSAKKPVLSRQTVEMRKKTEEIAKFAFSIGFSTRNIPSTIAPSWNVLKQACTKMVLTPSRLGIMPSKTDPTSLEIGIIEPERNST